MIVNISCAEINNNNTMFVKVCRVHFSVLRDSYLAMIKEKQWQADPQQLEVVKVSSLSLKNSRLLDMSSKAHIPDGKLVKAQMLPEPPNLKQKNNQRPSLRKAVSFQVCSGDNSQLPRPA
jgi:hypothetical protein